MITISLCLIVKNEEETLGRCLDSLKDALDEIIIVDTGSTDRTKEIARKYTSKVYDFVWIDDFGAARNFAFSHATQDYTMWLDADDVLLASDLQKLLLLKQDLDPLTDSVTMNYNLASDENGNIVSSLRRNRLVKQTKQFQWIGAVHEYLAVNGKIINSDITVTHKKERNDTADRNLKIYQKRIANGEILSPRDLFYYGNELVDHQKNREATEYYLKFLDTGLGWVEDNISACGKLADCFSSLGDEEQKLKYIYRSFEYDTPRSDFCCRLGYHFLNSQRHSLAIFWYKLAINLEDSNHASLKNFACSTWLPHLQLCVCYSKIGENTIALEHNKLAESFVPNHPSVIYNKKYFKELLSSS